MSNKISELIKVYEDKNFKIIRISPKHVEVEKIYEFLIKNNKNLEEVIVIAR